MNHIFPLIMVLITPASSNQKKEITSKLYETYENYKEPNLNKRRVKQNDILPLINKFKNNSKFTIQKVGESIEGRNLTLISIGTGEINVFLWSQMHGDESTGTQAIFDIFNFFNSDEFSEEKEAMLTNLTLHFLPILNPDGAEKFTRRNALKIDINRDASQLQSPESQTLKKIRDRINADFGFNLHDQSIYYNVEHTNNPATISYLAPPYNFEKDINDTRANAMKVIVYMNNIIQKYAPGQVGRYNDDFEPRAFGDNIQKWGTSTILIEAGGFHNDIEKQEIRKLNYVSILSAIYTISQGNYKNISIKEYEKIPKNDLKLFDLKISGITFKLSSNDYIIDLGINRLEVDIDNHTNYYNLGEIIDQGDLSTYYGYETFDATDYTLVQGNIYPKMLKTINDLSNLNIYDLLKSGYAYLRIEQLPTNKKEFFEPIHLICKDYEIPDFKIITDLNATFFLQRDNKIEYAVINGFLINLNTKKNYFKNALIYKK